MDEPVIPGRLRRCPRITVLGWHLPVATSRRTRLLGLAGLPRERAGPGLLIPRCRSIHTFGMRFPIDVLFLDRADNVIETYVAVGPRRVVRRRAAAAVVELPAAAFWAAPGPQFRC
jgi:uncharacterized protein